MNFWNLIYTQLEIKPTCRQRCGLSLENHTEVSTELQQKLILFDITFQITVQLKSSWIQYLVIDKQLRGGMQALQQHQLVWLLRNSIRQRRPDASFCRPQPQAEGEGPQLWDGMFHNSIHVVCPCWEGQSVALWERMP